MIFRRGWKGSGSEVLLLALTYLLLDGELLYLYVRSMAALKNKEGDEKVPVTILTGFLGSKIIVTCFMISYCLANNSFSDLFASVLLLCRRKDHPLKSYFDSETWTTHCGHRE